MKCLLESEAKVIHVNADLHSKDTPASRSPHFGCGAAGLGGVAAFAAGVSLALMVPKIIQCARRRRRGADRTVWGGVQNGESHYHGFGVGAGTDI